jgi:PAS domain S-box-containing protein
MIMADGDGKIVLVNSQTERMFGFKRSELIGQPVEVLINEALRESHVKYRTDYMVAPQARPMGAGRELRGQRKDGTEFPVEIGINPLPTPHGMFVLAAVVDISERRRTEREREDLEARVRHSQKLESLGVLAGGIAHDFNNLLAAILGNAEIAANNLRDESPALPYLRRILSASRRAAELTRQMLAYSGRGRFELRRINTSAAVQEMSELLRVSLSKKARIRFEFQSDLPDVEVDPAQFNQVVLNLITNANEALGESGGEITIKTGLVNADEQYLAGCVSDPDVGPGTFVFIEVGDTGHGMDQPTQARIFDPFFSTKFTGRGLGLSAVIGIVRGHKGAICVHSAPGSGTRMRVLLPALDTQNAPAHVAAAHPWRGSGLVLVADDEDLVRGVTCAQLDSLGFQTIEAPNGNEAVARAMENEDKLVLAVLDLTMPGLDGDEAARRILARKPELPIVLASGYSAQDLSQRLRDHPNVVLLPKPFSMAEMQGAVRRALRQ